MLAHQANQTSWQDALVARHPRLFNIAQHGGTYTPGSPECDEGWRELLERACVRIQAAVIADGGTFSALQIKEKYGTLRFYWTGRLSKEAEHGIEDAVALAEARSACTCEVCGNPGVLHSRGGWLATACPDHARGEPVPVVAGWANIHLIRGTRDGKTAILVCRRYDRDTDSFIDVDPTSLGIEE
jgi:hypothetical protein